VILSAVEETKNEHRGSENGVRSQMSHRTRTQFLGSSLPNLRLRKSEVRPRQTAAKMGEGLRDWAMIDARGWMNWFNFADAIWEKQDLAPPDNLMAILEEELRERKRCFSHDFDISTKSAKVGQ
jgi:hypothetical protein